MPHCRIDNLAYNRAHTRPSEGELTHITIACVPIQNVLDNTGNKEAKHSRDRLNLAADITILTT